MIFTPQPEIIGAITDLFTAAASALLLFHLKGTNNNSSIYSAYWRRLFMVLSVVNLGGFIAHAFVWSDTAKLIIWTFLYPALIYTAVCFFMTAYIHAFKASPGKLIHWFIYISCAIFYIFALIFEYTGTSGIYFAIIPSGLFVISGLIFFFCSAINGSRSAKIALFALLPQLIGGYFQIIRRGGFKLIWYFDYNSIYHICLFATVIILFFAAREER